MLFPRSEKKPETLFLDFGLTGDLLRDTTASGGGVTLDDRSAWAAVTTGVVVPAVTVEVVAGDEPTLVRSGLGAAVPRTVAGVVVLGVGLAVPVVVDGAGVIGVTVPAGVRVDGVVVEPLGGHDLSQARSTAS